MTKISIINNRYMPDEADKVELAEAIQLLKTRYEDEDIDSIFIVFNHRGTQCTQKQ